MAAVHFNAEHTLAAVRPEHQPFYKRAFKHRLICGPRAYPLLSKPIALMTTDYREITDYSSGKTDSVATAFERRMLFERRHPSAAVIPLNPLHSEQVSPADEQLPLFAQAG